MHMCVLWRCVWETEWERVKEDALKGQSSISERKTPASPNSATKPDISEGTFLSLSFEAP